MTDTYAVCFDVVKDAVCANWPQQVNSIYTTRVDPYNPLCLFTNGDDGIVRSWDINTGQQSGCGTPPTGDMTADFSSAAATPNLGCSGAGTPQTFHDLTLNTPTTGFDSATLTIKDTNGDPVDGWTDVPFTAGEPVDLSGLTVDSVGATPTFHVTLHNVNTWVDAPDLTVTYTTRQPQLCVPLQVVGPCPTGIGEATRHLRVDPADLSAAADVRVNGGSLGRRRQALPPRAPATTKARASVPSPDIDPHRCAGNRRGRPPMDGSTVLATLQTGAAGRLLVRARLPGPVHRCFRRLGHHNTAPDGPADHYVQR